MKAVIAISRGGQISIPAPVRKRWGTTRLSIEDQGDRLVLRPIPADPIGAAMGSFRGGGPSSEQIRAEMREEDAEAEERKWGRQPDSP